MKATKKNRAFTRALSLFIFGALALTVTSAFAASSASDIGSVATHITKSFTSIGELMFAVSYIAGFGFVIAGIFKFKQHKDNPTQIPMGTPIAMVLIGVALVFLPSLLPSAGKTIFNNPQKGGFTGSGITQIDFK